MSESPNQPTVTQPVNKWLPFLCLLPLTPWLVVYLVQTWQFAAFRYIPLLLVLCVMLLLSRYQPSRPSWSGPLGVAMGAAGVVVALLGAFSDSPWLVWVGVVGLLAVIAGHWRAIDDGRAAWSVWLLFCFSIRPPGQIADRITQLLQTFSSKIASGTLDLLHVVHHRAGNVIELPDRRFMVEEACSGVQSLFALLFVAASLSVFYRRSLIQAAGMMLAAAVWATVMNVVRILVVILGHQLWNQDWTSGWQHELIGYVALSLAIGLLLSTDRLIFLFTGPVLELVDRVVEKRTLNPLIVSYNRLLAGGVGPWFERGRPVFAVPAEQRWQPLSRRLQIMILVPSVILFLLGIPRCWGYFDAPEQPPVNAIVLAGASLPEKIAGWQQVNFEVEQRPRDDTFGEHSAIWLMERGEQQSRVSVDYFFSGWHDLLLCYHGIGWEITDRQTISISAIKEGTVSQPWEAVQIVMKKANGQYALLVYSLCDTRGEPLASPIDSAVSQLGSKMFRYGVRPASFQLQVFIPLTAPPSPTLVSSAIELHQSTREILRNEVIKQVGSQ